ncbi:S8 family peptidase [Streptomyces palmae]|uniref:S8 family peptidase n=1 Tax=Streptomyces palmae TaxID=1701085 RepID=A0A4Z0H5S8_9ACTN|nr:S8 family peptidase [Streptomyces palmae]TGB07219.1 S8 family peptidase [Streptomyces palmae]
MRPSLPLAAAAALIAALPATTAPAHAAPPRPGPAAARPSPAPLDQVNGAIPGQYIVSLAAGVTPARVTTGTGVTPLYTYGRARGGFAARLNPSQVEMIRQRPGVVAVEQDATVSLPRESDSASVSTPGRATGATAGAPGARVPWGLTRINHREPGGTGYSVKATGAKVRSYIIDSGIELNHPEFGGRAETGVSFVQDGRGAQDCAGHGTHVAGVVGGRTVGVARQTHLVSVRVFDCAGAASNSALIAAINWVAEHARPPAVANLSMSGPKSAAVDRAVEGLADAGVFPVVAAGNGDVDACTVSPSGARGAFPVGAVDRRDRKAAFSNWGECVALSAPGVNIRSAFPGGGYRELSGTSMAAPFATGVAALYKDTHGDTPSDTLAHWLTGNATPGIDTTRNGAASGTPPLLLYTGGL